MSELDLLSKVEKEFSKRQIAEDKISEVLSKAKQFTDRRIIAGYASVAIVDREGQRIPVTALKEAVKQFMIDEHYRNVNVFHADVTVGRILPKWTNPEDGKIYETKVDDKGWYCVCEIRDDIEIADKVWSEIEKGNLRSFSIAGSSKAKKDMYQNGQMWQEVMKLEIYENTICEIPVNQMSKFDVLYSPNKIKI